MRAQRPAWTVTAALRLLAELAIHYWAYDVCPTSCNIKGYSQCVAVVNYDIYSQIAFWKINYLYKIYGREFVTGQSSHE